MVKLPGKNSTKIFINCPYDDEYEPIFRAIIFTVIANGFIPVCAKEKSGAEIRLEKILEMIHECGYGIHDISRTDIDKKTGLPRFNMPFELGLSVGCQVFGQGNLKNKEFFILDNEHFRYREFISDISGSDTNSHNSNPDEAIQLVNNWLGQKRIEKSDDLTDYIGSSAIIDYYHEFKTDLPGLCRDSKADITKMAHHELILLTSNWLKKKKEIEDQQKAIKI